MRIAVDAMGGDHAPEVTVEGAVAAARELGIATGLGGDSERIRPLRQKKSIPADLIEVVHAPDVVSMDDPATAPLRKKKNSSVRVAASLVREGKADGLVSAGHTGAAMVSAKMVIGTIEGVDRPALAAILPSRSGFSLLLDVGANIECKNEHFREFAVMGHLYFQLLFGRNDPSIGLLSIGEEDTKGTDRTKEAFNGRCYVIVTDGFTGNVLLKASESLGEMIETSLREEITKSFRASVGFLLSR